ncbi:MAG: response regulator [Chitinophagaceae bacterium]|nr:response regulator [Chitinophagaceae bacterium]
MPLSSYKTKKLRFVFIVYWFLLAYIVAALVWWFIELNNQNRQMTTHDISQLKKEAPGYIEETQKIIEKEKRKTAQYIGEGSVFFLVIMAGAFFIFRAVRRQLRAGQQQQNFMMAITHELKTPIAVTKLNLETLFKRKLDEAQTQKLLLKSIQETNRLNALCNNILLVSQIEDHRYNITKEAISLSVLAQGCINEFSSRFPQHAYHAVITDDIFIKGDQLLLQLAINNLVDNATKYSGKESAITISLTEEAGKIKLAVIDEGKGVADADIDHSPLTIHHMNQQKLSILLVEDEENLQEALKLNLELEDYEVTSAWNGVEALDLVQKEHFDLMILDVMLPELDGISVCETIRLQNNEIPILILSAKNSSADRVLGLKKGADDYLTKPFNLEELLLRVSKLLQKSKQLTARKPVEQVYSFGKNKIDFSSLECTTKDGSKITLTKKEIMLLKLLIENKNEVVTREKILQSVWGYNVYPTTRTIDNFILNFRKYFEEDSRNPKYFHSIRGIGYKFTE